MRVVHISKVTGVAGSEGHLLRLLPALAALGAEPSLVVLADPRYSAEAFCAEAARRGIPTHVERISGHLDLTLTARLSAHLRRVQPHIVHTHLIHADLYGLAAAVRAGVPRRISSRHNDDRFRRHPLIKAVTRRSMAQAQAVIAISGALAGFVSGVEGVPAAKVHTIHYGLEADAPGALSRAEARQGLGLPEDAPLIGFFGRLIAQKGVDVLLAAFDGLAVHHPAAHLLIVGDGPARAALEGQAASLSAADRVHFTGWLADAQRYMPACDVIAVPSRWEGFGLVTLEAMRHSLPLVVSRASALPEIVEEGRTGLIVPPEDAPALAAALSGVLADALTARQMGADGHRRLRESFSVEKMAQSTFELYQAVACAESAASSH